MEQPAPEARVLVQLLLCAKSPDAAMGEISSAFTPAVRTIFLALVVVFRNSLPKGNAVALILARAFTPAPDRGTKKLPASVPMPRVPVRLPRTVGVKVTPIVQLLPGNNVAGQETTLAKSPLIENASKLTGTIPEFVSVIACAELVVLSAWLAKAKACGPTVACGVAPFPLRFTEKLPAGV